MGSKHVATLDNKLVCFTEIFFILICSSQTNRDDCFQNYRSLSSCIVERMEKFVVKKILMKYL